MPAENLYHIKLTSVDRKADQTGAAIAVEIPATYTSLPAAKSAAATVLFEKGYEKDWFTTFDVKGQTAGEWRHRDGVAVYALSPDGSTFTVAIETTANTAGFEGDAAGRVTEPMWHVLQTAIHYNVDRSGAVRDSSIEGTFRSEEEAKTCAFGCLLDEDVTKESFIEFDEYSGQGDWAYGEDVMVHAVAQGGENYLVQVVRKP